MGFILHGVMYFGDSSHELVNLYVMAAVQLVFLVTSCPKFFSVTSTIALRRRVKSVSGMSLT